MIAVTNITKKSSNTRQRSATIKQNDVHDCYKCGIKLIGTARSREHILPNFIGGRLTSSDLICNACNNEFGSTIDAELSRQLYFMADLTVMNRERPKAVKVPLYSKSGAKVLVKEGLVPLTKLNIKINGKEPIILTSQDHDEMLKMANKKKEELQPKFGDFELTEIIEEPHPEKVYFTESGQVELGGRDFYRAIGKIILNYYLLKFPNTKRPQELIDFVCGVRELNDKVYNFHPNHYALHGLKEHEFSHIISLRGEKEIGAIYCYLELFNSEKYLCIIDMEYTGDDFKHEYAFDVITGQVIQKELTLQIYRHTLQDLPIISFSHRSRRETSFQEFEKRLEKLQDVMPIA